MATLFDAARDVSQDIFRNIVSLRESQDLFDDLTDGDEELSRTAIELEAHVKRDMPLGLVNRGFAYSMAIGYPFETQPFMSSRFGDGTFGVWYGALEGETTIYETAYHMMRAELCVAGIDEIVIRERAVYWVFCNAVLLDMTAKGKDFPQLTASDYGFTQQLGRRTQREGHPGLLARSARSEGTNAVIFNPDVLNNPRLAYHLSYAFDPATQTVKVERTSGELLMVVNGASWF